MRKAIVYCIVLVFAAGTCQGVATAQKHQESTDKAYYKVKYRDPVLKEIEEAREAAEAAADSVTGKIREDQKEQGEKEKEEAKKLVFDFEGVEIPESPDVFESAFHFPPTPQYYTGTCWCFAATSFFESETCRLTGKKIKLSEMYTVYYEYLEKVRRFVQERGDSYVEQGSETNAVMRVWKKYGVVPRSVYEGVLAEGGRYDHEPMMEEIKDFLALVEDHGLWEEDYVLGAVRLILGRYMGEPPAEFRWEGRTYTPRGFMKDLLKINPDDYVDVISTLRFPFYTKGEFEVPDNWWHSEEYYNLPLDVWYEVVLKAAQNGYTLAIGGDVSEPGYQGFEDAAIVPPFDIPEELIDQDARELRFANGTSSDDHALHLVGHTRLGNHDWFLIKDSARSSRWGKYEGRYFYREDYVRLKMLSYTVHKDAIKGTSP
ncbi:MAG: peptidase C1 [Candidatus Eisenbacteria sp.]|nr:peptidase C1 [Candidatus Eisenbacteria bacterium]